MITYSIPVQRFLKGVCTRPPLGNNQRNGSQLTFDAVAAPLTLVSRTKQYSCVSSDIVTHIVHAFHRQHQRHPVTVRSSFVYQAIYVCSCIAATTEELSCCPFLSHLLSNAIQMVTTRAFTDKVLARAHRTNREPDQLRRGDRERG